MMADQKVSQRVSEAMDPLNRDQNWTVTPGFDEEILLWVALLGIPSVLLLMIYFKLYPSSY